MLRTKNEGISEQESETKGDESQVGTGSNDQSENRQITQQEPVKKLKQIETKNCGHNVYETKFAEKHLMLKRNR